MSKYTIVMPKDNCIVFQKNGESINMLDLLKDIYALQKENKELKERLFGKINYPSNKTTS